MKNKNEHLRKLMGGCLTVSLLLAGCTSTEAASQPASASSAVVEASASVAEESKEASSAAEEVPEASSPTEEASSGVSTSTTEETASEASGDLVTGGTYEDSSNGGHAIEADGIEASYTGVTVNKTGEADGDEADFYGENAAVFATNGATLSITDSTVNSNGKHANGIFSYGEGTTVNVSGTTIETSGNCSGGLMVTGGGTLIANDLTIHTTGNSSAAIRSDRGGGTETVTGGTYTTEGTGSPVIYSTADVTVNDAQLTSTASQGVVVEGKNSVTLKNVDLTADNNTKNSDKSDVYQAVMIYQSMSGDADEGEAAFSMEDGSLTNKNGDIFFVNNTVAAIDLTNVEITNEDTDGVFLRAEAAGWGNEGSNGGHVTLTATDQKIDGDIAVDEVSSVNLYLNGSSSFSGAITLQEAASSGCGEVYVEIAENAVWKLTGDSQITSLTCDADAIDLNGYTLTVQGEVYQEGSASEGEPVVVKISSSGSNGDRPDGPPGEGGQGGPGGSGEGGPSSGSNGQPPEPPSGSNGQPPEPPSGSNGQPPEPPSGSNGQPPEPPSGSNGQPNEATPDAQNQLDGDIST